MAKGRKPAIDGVARPQGFLDDIVRPIIQKGARKVKDVAFTSNLPRSARTNIVRSARNIESNAEIRRQLSYAKKTKKNLYKMQDRLPHDNPKAKVPNSAFRYAKKSGVAAAKEQAILEGSSVRKAAKRARKDYK